MSVQKDVAAAAKALDKQLRDFYWAFLLYHELKVLLAPNIVGKTSANKNLLIMTRHKVFFSIVLENLQKQFFLELAKFFDQDKRSHDVNNLLKELVRTTSADDQVAVSGLVARMRVIRKSGFLGRLKEYRDQHLGHADIEKRKITIMLGEVLDTKAVLTDIINFAQRITSRKTTGFGFIEKDCSFAAKKLIKALE